MIKISFNEMYRGFQLKVLYCCKNKKEASILLDKSIYFINNWCHINKPDGEIEPYKKYVSFVILSGEIRYVKDDLQGKVLLYEDVISMIDNHRKKYKTYYDTEKAWEKKTLLKIIDTKGCPNILNSI